MTRQNHIISGQIKLGKKTYAHSYWSLNPSGHAIVFVHGFGGSATGTWNEFGLLLPQHEKCAGCDLLFYGYDGLYAQASLSAGLLETFLDTLFHDPLKWIAEQLLRERRKEQGFEYKSVLIVAHSLGAIVTRRAILDARQNSRDWVGRTSMVLFAPAHSGAENVIALGSEALSAIPYVGRVLAQFGKFRYQPLSDMEKDSPTLDLLKQETEAALAAGTADYLKARKVIFGSDERIVRAMRFCSDPAPVVIEGKDHGSVCKPAAAYADPVTLLIEVLP